MTQYYDSHRRIVITGNQIGRGGEGTVLEIQGNSDLVAKIWTKPDQSKAEKIAAIIRNRVATTSSTSGATCAWPQDLLKNQQGEPAGYLMPKVDTREFDQSFAYFNKSQRDKTEQKHGIRIDQATLVTTARNLALAVAGVHEAGQVIGDVNEKNVLVNRNGDAVIVDMDSIQVHDRQTGKTHLCEVGREDYTPPRMQGRNFRQEARTKDDDCFGLTVLIFKFIMGGMHPFSSVVEPDDQTAIAQLGEKIKQQLFPYNEDSTVPDRYKVAAPEYKAAWDNARDEIKTLFREAFDPFYIKNNPRPDGERWSQVLRRELELIKRGSTTQIPTNAAGKKGTGGGGTPIVQGAKAANQAIAQYAINLMEDDLKSLIIDYAEQGLQERVWSFNDLPKKPLTTKNLRTIADLQKMNDVLGFLHTLESITKKLDPAWTQRQNLHPNQIEHIMRMRNAGQHELDKFSDADYTKRVLRSIDSLHGGIRNAPRPWPKEAVNPTHLSPGGSIAQRPHRPSAPGRPKPNRPQQGNRPPTNRPGPHTGPQQASTGPGWEELTARTLRFIGQHPLALLLAFMGIAIVWFAPRLSGMEEKGTWTLLTIPAALLCEWLCRRKSCKDALRKSPNLARKTWEAASRVNDRKVRMAMQSAIGVTGVVMLGIPIAIAVFLATSPGSETGADEPQQAAEASVPQTEPVTQPLGQPPAEDPDTPTVTGAETGINTEDKGTPPSPSESEKPLPQVAQEGTTPATAEPEFLHFTDSSADFTFIYPAEWDRMDTGVGQNFHFKSPTGERRLGVTSLTSEPEWSLEELANHIGENNPKNWEIVSEPWKEYEEVERLTGSTEETEFVEIHFLGQRETGGCLLKGTTRVFRSKYFGEFTIRAFSFTFSACEEDMKNLGETAERVLNSFTEHNHDWEIQKEIKRRVDQPETETSGPTGEADGE